jgi:hypothetical protein
MECGEGEHQKAHTEEKEISDAPEWEHFSQTSSALRLLSAQVMKTNHCWLKIEENLKTSVPEINVPYCLISNHDDGAPKPLTGPTLGSLAT